MTKQGFSEPKLSEFGGDMSREWYVSFNHTCPTCQVRKAYQIRMGINFLKTATGRPAEGKGVATLLHTQLKAGWNPHHQSIEDFVQKSHSPAVSAKNKLQFMPFNEALAFALEEKRPNLADKSYRGFKTCLDYAQRAAKQCGIWLQAIGETRKAHIKELLSQMVRDRQKDYDAAGKGMQVSGNFYNKYKGYLVCILSELVEFEALEYNPAVGLRDRPAIKTNIHRHATQQERDMIKSTLQLQHPEFYTYLATQYYAGIRPNEIFSIRICDIDWFSGYISLHPCKGGSKTRQSRRVPMPEELEKLFRRMGLEKRNPTLPGICSASTFWPGRSGRNATMLQRSGKRSCAMAWGPLYRSTVLKA